MTEYILESPNQSRDARAYDVRDEAKKECTLEAQKTLRHIADEQVRVINFIKERIFEE